MALTSISLNNGATVHGRLLARNGQVSLINNVLDRPVVRDCTTGRPTPPADATPGGPAPGGTRPAPPAPGDGLGRHRSNRPALAREAQRRRPQRHRDAAACPARGLHRRIPRHGPRPPDQARRLQPRRQAHRQPRPTSPFRGARARPQPARTRSGPASRSRTPPARKTLTLRYRACAAAALQPAPAARRSSPDDPPRSRRPATPRLSPGGLGVGGRRCVAAGAGCVLAAPARAAGASGAREPAARGAAARSRRPDRAQRRTHAGSSPSPPGGRSPACAPSFPVLGHASSRGGRLLGARPASRAAQRTQGLDPRPPDQAHLHRVAASRSSSRPAGSPSTTTAAPTRRFRGVVGKPSTPTPRGRVLHRGGPRALLRRPGGPFALATSARSNVLQEFEGGPGQIALHGTNNLSGALGTAVSHGCIRLSTERDHLAGAAHRRRGPADDQAVART